METPDWANAIAAALGGAGTAFLAMRRKWSRDTASIIADRAESNLIAMLVSERDNALAAAKEAWAQRTEDAIKITRWETLQEINEKENIRLRGELFSMRIHVRKLTAIIVRLDPSTAALLNLHDDSDGITSDTEGVDSPTPATQKRSL